MKKVLMCLLLVVPMTLGAQHYRVKSFSWERVEVTSAWDASPDSKAQAVITPYKGRVDSIMAPTLGMSRVAMSAWRPESLLGNWAADMLVEAGTATGLPPADMGLINVGGLRNNMPAGIVRTGDIMQIAPFENSVVVLELKGSDMLELMHNIASVHGEAVSKSVRMVITKDGKLVSATINGEPIDKNRTYTVATIDFLAEGNDKMHALTKAVKRHDIKLLVRNAMMENIIKTRIIDSKLEGRITIEGESNQPAPATSSAPKEKDATSDTPLSLPLWQKAPGGLFLMHTSDTHSCVEPISPNFSDTLQANKAGYLRRATLLNQLRQEYGDQMLVLDCGDFSQGSVYYNLFKGEVEVKLMNQMHYDACGIGNHEFDFGLDNLARLIRMADFPFVCCNYDFTGTPCEGLVKPYVVLERHGMRIGIFGVSPEMDGLVVKANYGKTKFTAPAIAAQPVIDRLRSQEKCDVVICLSHLGWGKEPYMDQEFIRNTTGIDVLLGGHTHTYFSHPEYMKDKLGHEVIVDHAGKNARFIGTIEMMVE